MHRLEKAFMDAIRPVVIEPQIRLGSKNDGGYLVPKVALENTNHLIAIGYGHNSDFETGFLKLNHANRVELYESSINIRQLVSDFLKSLTSVSRSKRAFPMYRLKCLVKYLKMRARSGISYFPYEVIAGPEEKENQISLQRILSSLSDPTSTILKIDIEGAEYRCLESVSLDSNLFDVRCLIIEFHEIHTNKDIFLSTIQLLKAHFYISHVHLNNFAEITSAIPSVMELVLVNRGIIPTSRDYVQAIPHELDKPCNPNKSDYSYTWS